jgi:TPR repeat protein
MKRYSSLSLLALLFLASAIWALDIDDAVHAMREGNFAEAYCLLRPHADAGDAEAQYNIGWMYLNGYGLAINDSLALEWWQRAADQGNVDAIFSMAMLYSLGEGQVKKDMDRAIDLYLLAAEDGHEDARLIIRSMLQRNDRAIRDRKQQIVNTYGSMLGTLKQVRVKRVNIRSGPSLDKAIVASAKQGELILTLSEKGKWTQVILKDSGNIAWVYTSLLEDIPDIEAPVTDEVKTEREAPPEEASEPEEDSEF